jgi:hypothetical protein
MPTTLITKVSIAEARGSNGAIPFLPLVPTDGVTTRVKSVFNREPDHRGGVEEWIKVGLK